MESTAVLTKNAGSSFGAGVHVPALAETASSAPAPVDRDRSRIDGQAAEIPEELPFNSDDASLFNEFVIEARSHIERGEAALLTLEEEPKNKEALGAAFRSFHSIKGVAGFLNLRQIGALAHHAENLLELARNGKVDLVGRAADATLEAVDLMKSMLSGLEEATRTGFALPQQERLPAVIGKLDACAMEGEPDAAPNTASRPQEQIAPPETIPLPESASAPGGKPEPVKVVQGTPTAGSDAVQDHSGTVKIATQRLDALIDMVGELVIAQSMVSVDMSALTRANQRAARNIDQLGKITRELQELSMSLRMVPIHGTFQKMTRLVRDTSQKAGKAIDLKIEGGDTELDRYVVEAIGDPLVHMVRNAVDHGIESREERVRAGKSPTGQIRLRAHHQAGMVVIEIADDGAGLRQKKILQKAIDAGIVKADDRLNEQQIFNLIFHAGLSTADKVSDVSGRGVGMDVVKKNVEALRGRVEISSREGVGTTFQIRLPLTLAVIDGLVVRIGSERYIVPITSIERSLRPLPDQVATILGKSEVCLVSDRSLPLVRLYRMFNITPRTEDPTDAMVIIVQDDLRRCGLMVDDLIGQQQVVIKSLGADFGRVKGISGGAILGDGNVSLILDVPGLIDLAERTGNV